MPSPGAQQVFGENADEVFHQEVLAGRSAGDATVIEPDHALAHEDSCPELVAQGNNFDGTISSEWTAGAGDWQVAHTVEDDAAMEAPPAESPGFEVAHDVELTVQSGSDEPTASPESEEAGKRFADILDATDQGSQAKRPRLQEDDSAAQGVSPQDNT